MKCPKCGSESIRISVNFIFSIPIKFYLNVRKKDLQRGDFELQGAEWCKAIFLCNDCGCGWWPEVDYV